MKYRPHLIALRRDTGPIQMLQLNCMQRLILKQTNTCTRLILSVCLFGMFLLGLDPDVYLRHMYLIKSVCLSACLS